MEKHEDIATSVNILEERIKSVQRTMDERDRFYLEKFKAAEIAVSAALTASDKLNAAAFSSGEKAVIKAEDAQREYNVRSNEFRGQLDDQAKRLMPREEAQTHFGIYDQKFDEIKEEIAAFRVGHQSTAQSIDLQTLRSDLTKEIQNLRESRSEGSGKEKAYSVDQAQRNWTNANMVVLGVALLGWVISLIVYVVSNVQHIPVAGK
jgi:hypothetical protein